ncbi:TPA: hypothetical protein ACOB50_001902 [Neisseria gonorrhoeae]
MSQKKATLDKYNQELAELGENEKKKEELEKSKTARKQNSDQKKAHRTSKRRHRKGCGTRRRNQKI